MSYPDATATEVEELERIAELLENMEEAIAKAFALDGWRMPGISLEAYSLHRYHALTHIAAANLRRLLDGVRGKGGGDVPPPGPRDVEDLLCWCGFQVQEQRMGLSGTWVRFCPDHGLHYAEPDPEATHGRSAGSRAHAHEEARDA